MTQPGIEMVEIAKREDTIQRRIAFVFDRSEKNIKPELI